MVLNDHMMADSIFVPILETQRDVVRQFFIIKFIDVQPADHQYHIHIKYTGRLQDNMDGFYKSSYNVGNTTRSVRKTGRFVRDNKRVLLLRRQVDRGHAVPADRREKSVSLFRRTRAEGQVHGDNRPARAHEFHMQHRTENRQQFAETVSFVWSGRLPGGWGLG